MIMLFRVRNIINNNFYNNLQNIGNLLVEYQGDLAQYNKISKILINGISSEKCYEKCEIFII